VETIDLKKTHKNLYQAEITPTQVVAADSAFLAVDGIGRPGGEIYQRAIEKLYGIAYTVKFALQGADVLVSRSQTWSASGSAIRLRYRWTSGSGDSSFESPMPSPRDTFRQRVQSCSRRRGLMPQNSNTSVGRKALPFKYYTSVRTIKWQAPMRRLPDSLSVMDWCSNRSGTRCTSRILEGCRLPS
jgi:hypothetical protein